MVRSYRTISLQAPLTLAEMIPLDLLAKAKARFYHRVDAMKNEGRTVLDSEIKELRTRAHGHALRV